MKNRGLTIAEKFALGWPLVIIVTVLALVFFLLTTFEADYLWMAQELNLFLCTPEFFAEQFSAPGSLLTWMGTLFTTFFFYPYFGVGVLILMWVFLMYCIGGTFNIPLGWSCLLLVPISAILITIVGLGYWIYYMSMPGHLFASTIGTTLSVCSVWLFRKITASHYFRIAYMALIIPLLYHLIGWYGLMASLLMAIISWRVQDMKSTYRIQATCIAMIFTISYPLTYYYTLNTQNSLHEIYMVGIPSFYQGEYHFAYLIPYYFIVFTLCIMAATYNQNRKSSSTMLPVRVCCQLVLVVVMTIIVSCLWFKDYNFHKELSMQRCLERFDWEGILKESELQEDEPTRAVVMMRNLALFRLGKQGDEMYHYRSGNKAYKTSLPNPLARMLASVLYFHYGQLNYCMRWAIEEAMETGLRMTNLKYLIRSALANGEECLADKYIDIMDKTLWYKDWTLKYKDFLFSREAMMTDAEFAPSIRLSKSEDMLGNDYGRVELFIMHQFAFHDNEDTLFQEQAVLSAMWTKKPQLFWPRFYSYISGHPGIHIPIHFQEAALLFATLNGIDTQNIPFDTVVLENFESYVKQRKNTTYYYEYFMTPDHNQY